MIAVGGENLIDLVSMSSENGLPVYTAYQAAHLSMWRWPQGHKAGRPVI